MYLKPFLKRCIPVLAVFALLLSMIPTLPVSAAAEGQSNSIQAVSDTDAQAADQYVLSGYWLFDDVLDMESYVMFSTTSSCVFTLSFYGCLPNSSGRFSFAKFTDLYYRDSYLRFGVSESVYHSSSGWLSSAYRLIYFSEPTALSKDQYGWFLSNATCVDDTYSLVIPAGDYVSSGLLTTFPTSCVPSFLKFSSSDCSFLSVSFFNDWLYYGGSKSYSYTTNKFASALYSAITVDADQRVSADFYNWFTANYRRKSNKLAAPTLTLSGDRLSIAFDGDDSVTTFAIYVDGELATTVYRTDNLTDFSPSDLGLSPGTYQLTVAGCQAQTILTDTSAAVTYTAVSPSLAAGSWRAHSSLTAWPLNLGTVSLAFTAAGRSYSAMSSSIYLPSGGNCLYYGDLSVYGYGPLEKDTGWKDSKYSSIFFASDQSVSTDFYTWFTANFDYVGADPVVQEVKTIINIYDQTGNVLLNTITFTGSGSAPEVSFSVGFDGCVFSSNGSDVPWSFVYADYSFMGFSVNNASGDPAYVPDESYTLPGGAGVDTVWSLYVVQTTQKLYRFNFYDTSFRLCDSFYFYADGAVTVTLMPLPVEDPNGGLTYVKFAVFYNDTNHVVEVGNFVSVWDLIDGRLYQTCCDLKTGAGPMQATKALGNAGGVFSLYFSVSAHDCLDLNGNYLDGFTAEDIIAPDPSPDDDSSGSSAGAAFAGFGNFAMVVIRGLLDFEFAPGLSLGSIVEFFVYIALFLLFLKLTS